MVVNQPPANSAANGSTDASKPQTPPNGAAQPDASAPTPPPQNGPDPQMRFQAALDALVESLPSLAADELSREHFDVKGWLIEKLAYFRPTSRLKLVGRLQILARRLATLPPEAAAAQYHQAWEATRMLRSNVSPVAARAVIDDLDHTDEQTRPLRRILGGLVCYFIVTTLLFIWIVHQHLIIVDPASVDRGYMVYDLSGRQGLFEAGYVFACIFGALGAVVSIFFRLSEFEALTGKSRTFLMLTGAFLPVVGSTFAIVIYAIFRSGAFDFNLGGLALTKSPAIYEIPIILGFLCGFSERFARGTLDKIAQGATGETSEKQTP